MAPVGRDVAGSLLVAECFGPTFQSEGLQPASWRWSCGCPDATCPARPATSPSPGTGPGSIRRRKADASPSTGWWNGAVSSQARLVVVTGGEPLLQQDRLVALVSQLAGLGFRVEIETNGTLAPTPELAAVTHLFVVSPKLLGFAAVASPANRINSEALTAFVDSGRAVFTFVVQTLDDLHEIIDLEQRLGLYPIWVMPEGTTPGRVLAGMCWLAEHALAHGWHLSGRLHVLLREARRSRETETSGTR